MPTLKARPHITVSDINSNINLASLAMSEPNSDGMAIFSENIDTKTTTKLTDFEADKTGLLCFLNFITL